MRDVRLKRFYCIMIICERTYFVEQSFYLQNPLDKSKLGFIIKCLIKKRKLIPAKIFYFVIDLETCKITGSTSIPPEDCKKSENINNFYSYQVITIFVFVFLLVIFTNIKFQLCLVMIGYMFFYKHNVYKLTEAQISMLEAYLDEIAPHILLIHSYRRANFFL